MLDTAEKVYTKQFNETNKRYLSALARFTKPKDYDRFCKNAYAILGFDARADLSTIQCPTYILSGNCDNTVGNEAPYDLQAGIPHAEVTIFDGLGHGLFEEDKEFYNKVFEICER